MSPENTTAMNLAILRERVALEIGELSTRGEWPTFPDAQIETSFHANEEGFPCAIFGLYNRAKTKWAYGFQLSAIEAREEGWASQIPKLVAEIAEKAKKEWPTQPVSARKTVGGHAATPNSLEGRLARIERKLDDVLQLAAHPLVMYNKRQFPPSDTITPPAAIDPSASADGQNSPKEAKSGVTARMRAIDSLLLNLDCDLERLTHAQLVFMCQEARIRLTRLGIVKELEKPPFLGICLVCGEEIKSAADLIPRTNDHNCQANRIYGFGPVSCFPREGKLQSGACADGDSRSCKLAGCECICHEGADAS